MLEGVNLTAGTESAGFAVGGGEPPPVRLVLSGQNVVDGYYGRLVFADVGLSVVGGGEPLHDVDG